MRTHQEDKDLFMVVTFSVLIVASLVMLALGNHWQDQAYERGDQVKHIQRGCRAEDDGSAICRKGTFIVEKKVRIGDGGNKG